MYHIHNFTAWAGEVPFPIILVYSINQLISRQQIITKNTREKINIANNMLIKNTYISNLKRFYLLKHFYHLLYLFKNNKCLEFIICFCRVF